MILKLLLLLVFTAMSQATDKISLPVVCTPHVGCLRGNYVRGSNMYQAFLGVPYARPPVGKLRFKSPEEFPSWGYFKVYNATEAKSDCIQKNYLLSKHPVGGSEDCLYLNVYRPALRSDSLLPVMLYIVGGGWFSGSANPAILGPEHIMDNIEDAILITFSYRLGAFGFLSTGDEAMPGNFGLKDQLLVMKWVNKNIRFFGGDPEKVTLVGQDVGGVSAHMHMLSRQSEGLFHGVIALSGTANVHFAINDEPLQQAIQVAKLCNIENAAQLTSEQLLEALQSVNANTLLQAGDGLKFWDVDPISNYRPVVESLNVKDAFFTVHPHDILKSGKYQPVPFMLGFVPEEGAARVLPILESQELTESFNSDFLNNLKAILEFPPYLNGQQLHEAMTKIIDEYFKGEHEINSNTRLGLLEMVSDRSFHHPFYNTVKTYVNTTDTEKYPIYLQSFNYKGPYSYSAVYTGDMAQHEYGVVHSDDLIYLFRSPLLFADFPQNSPAAKVSQAYVDNIVHFASHQKPRQTNLLNKCTKTSFQRNPDTICDYQLFQNYDQNFRILASNEFNTRRMKFWDEILTHRGQ